MPRYDIEQVKLAASGRWPEAFSVIAGVSESLFDGSHHGCPKYCAPDHGGRDRFRLIDTKAGACLCNQCFKTKNGDGFAVLAWLCDKDFAWALQAVAEHFRVLPMKSSKLVDPAEHLEFLPWSPTLVHLWCMKKKPIKPEAIQAIGGRLARYRGQYIVIAIPVLGPSLESSPPVGWVLYRSDGGDLPKWKKGQSQPEWVKVKLTAGSQKGIIKKVEQNGDISISS